MINVGPKLEHSFRLHHLPSDFPTATYVAGRLQKVGWESDYAKSVLNNFREDLIKECGNEFPEVLRQLRFIAQEEFVRVR
jgi:hypothetical protein